MHRDQKIGLSLAVLIIGFTGAFCLRDESLSDPHPLALDQFAALDSRIRQLPIRAYTPREAIRPPQTPLGEPQRSADIGDAAVTGRPIDLVEIGRVPPSGDLLDLFAGPPEPLMAEAGSGAVLPTSGSEFNPADLPRPPAPASPVGTRLREAVASPQELPAEMACRPPQPTEVTYLVKSGDTLIGISLRMYGTSRRYLDIYRANRDVLTDPNDLPVGTSLRIPSASDAFGAGGHRPADAAIDAEARR